MVLGNLFLYKHVYVCMDLLEVHWKFNVGGINVTMTRRIQIAFIWDAGNVSCMNVISAL